MYLPLPSSVLPIVLAATLLLVGWLGWAGERNPEALWAPGDLSQYHAEIGSCTGCHQAFRGPTTAKCVGCHSAQWFAETSEATVNDFHQSKIRDGRSCLDCHREHRGRLVQIVIGETGNPHGEYIFLATGTTSCTECHAFGSGPGQPTTLLENDLAKGLLKKGRGMHRPGEFADCLQCHVSRSE